MTDASNLLIIMADEYNPKIVGCYGNDLVQTPNIDKLAQGGTRFERAYTPSPICMPARAAFATGQYPHQTGYWDNCLAYDGKVPGWGHRLQKTDHEVVSIGKLHYTGEDISSGFDERIVPMHVVDGGDVHGLDRSDPPFRPQARGLAETAGPSGEGYVPYDIKVTEEACKWLNEKGKRPADKPWTLFVSFACPHFPLTPPQEFYDLYSPEDMPLPKQRIASEWEPNEWWQAFENCYVFDQFFEDDAHRQQAIAAYYGLCSFVDANVGHVLQALANAGLDENTRVIFTADHGENLGARGLWGKSVMYEEAVGVPFIISGPGIPKGRVCKTPISLIDLYPTILDCMGEEPYEDLSTYPGTSILEILQQPDDISRIIFSEYHATAAKSAEYMLCKGRYKYIHYVGYEPELYDLDTDPEELHNLANNPNCRGILRDFERLLRAMIDPEELDQRAKAAQAELIEQYGGIEAVRSIGGPVTTPPPPVE